MKQILLFFFLLTSLAVSAQKIGGFYAGTLYNDSTKMVQKYELALSEYKGKISGYSYVTFVINDTFYYGIRKIKANIVGDSLIVVDDKMLINNFPEAPAKGVGRMITIPLKGQDSVIQLEGRWKTNQTKKYYSVPGAIDLNKSSDSAHSPLISHLKELNIIPSTPYQQTDNLTAIRAKEKADEQVRVETERKIREERKMAAAEASLKAKEAQKRLQDELKAKSEAEVKARKVLAEKNKLDAEARKKIEDEQKKMMAAEEKKKRRDDEERKKLLAEENKKLIAEENKRIEVEARIKGERLKAEEERKKALAASIIAPVKLRYDQRSNKIQQALEVFSDSLILSFYDNGVVDGDSISVYLNDQPVILNAKLTTVATKKIIGIVGLDDIRILLVAENLGTLPPNTGLMTIRDGENIYQVNFSADLQTNATIVIRRKKK